MSAEDAQAIALSTQQAGLERNKIHIRVQNRGTRKYVTSVQGIDQRANFERILKHWKEDWGCSGIVTKATSTSGNSETVIQLNGNFAGPVKTFLIEEGFVTEDDIVVHGLNTNQ